MTTHEFTIGCDPELFIKTLDGDYVSAYEMIPGTKEFPHVVDGGAIQVDGCALEFNINPAKSLNEFELNIDKVINELSDRIENPFSDLQICYDPTATFERDYFESLPMEAKLLGCTPDFNAYTGEENEPPFTKEPFRTAGGHIHLGWGKNFDPFDSGHFNLCREVVKQLDAVLYPASKIWDRDELRRKLYGKKGAFRPKTYGVEYRPLSCMWLKEPETIQFVYETSMRALDLFFNKGVKLYDN